MIDYFPASPIAHWPNLPEGWSTIDELIVELGINTSADTALMMSEAYHDGRPLPCIQCGRHVDPEGNALCEH